MPRLFARLIPVLLAAIVLYGSYIGLDEVWHRWQQTDGHTLSRTRWGFLIVVGVTLFLLMLRFIVIGILGQ